MRSVIVHTALAVAGLVGAYLVWTGAGETEVADEAVTVWDCEPESVGEVVYDAERRKVSLTAKKADGERRWWVRVEPKKTEDEKSGKTKSSPGADEPKHFAASDAVDEYLKKIAPLTARRSLGDVEKETLKELELAEPSASLAVSCGGKTRTFDVGGSAFGSGDRYVREQGGGPVYLLGSQAVTDLRSAEARLMQRELHRFEMTEVKNLVVRAEGEEITLLQRNRLDPRKAEWVDADKPDRRNEMYGNWLSRVHRLRVSEYLPPGAEPGSEARGTSVAKEKVLELRYSGEDGEALGRLEMARLDTEPARYYAKSEATGGAWVTLVRSVAGQVRSDVRPILGLEPLEEEETESETESESGTESEPGTESETGTESGTESESESESESGTASKTGTAPEDAPAPEPEPAQP